MKSHLLFDFLSVLVFILQILAQLSFVAADVGTRINLTEFHNQRQKRGIMFANGGAIKVRPASADNSFGQRLDLSIGSAIPLILSDPLSWRSLVSSYSLQGGAYKIPNRPLYHWDKWEDTFARSLKKMKRKFDNYGHYEQDESRELVYMVLERYMAHSNTDGRQCLLRAICENAHIHEHIGVFANILNVILTPGKEKLDSSYRMSFEAGRHGVDCGKLFSTCPKGSSLLDQYIDEL